jgi:hypothetical protein
VVLLPRIGRAKQDTSSPHDYFRSQRWEKARFGLKRGGDKLSYPGLAYAYLIGIIIL